MCGGYEGGAYYSPAGPQSWSGAQGSYNTGYTQYPYASQSAAPAAQYPPVAAPGGAPGSTVLYYPHVFSTFNQNQIHLHVHTDGKAGGVDSYPEEVPLSSLAPLRNAADVLQEAATVADALKYEDRKYEDGASSDPATVWRPY